MTVEELIAALSQLDLKATVLFRDHDSWFYDLEACDAEKLNIVEGRAEDGDGENYVILKA